MAESIPAEDQAPRRVALFGPNTSADEIRRWAIAEQERQQDEAETDN
jgi:hypothetical protein